MPGDNARVLNQTIAESEVGGGYLADYPLNIVADGRTSGALTLTAGTNPIVAAVTGYYGVQWAAGDVAPLLLNFTIPGEYDDESPEKIQLILVVNNLETGSVTIDATMQPARAGTAITTALASDGAQTMTGGDAAGTGQRVTITWSRTALQTRRIRHGDQVQFLITPGTHAAAALNLFSAKVRLRRNACLTQKSSRF